MSTTTRAARSAIVFLTLLLASVALADDMPLKVLGGAGSGGGGGVCTTATLALSLCLATGPMEATIP